MVQIVGQYFLIVLQRACPIHLLSPTYVRPTWYRHVLLQVSDLTILTNSAHNFKKI